MSETKPSCIVCEVTDQQVPLVTLLYQSEVRYICAQHLPILIHHPEKLVGVLPGAESFNSSEHED